MAPARRGSRGSASTAGRSSTGRKSVAAALTKRSVIRRGGNGSVVQGSISQQKGGSVVFGGDPTQQLSFGAESDGVFVSRIGSGPPKRQMQRLSIPACRKKMRCALIADRLRYARPRPFRVRARMTPRESPRS